MNKVAHGQRSKSCYNNAGQETKGTLEWGKFLNVSKTVDRSKYCPLKYPHQTEEETNNRLASSSMACISANEKVTMMQMLLKVVFHSEFGMSAGAPRFSWWFIHIAKQGIARRLRVSKVAFKGVLIDDEFSATAART